MISGSAGLINARIVKDKLNDLTVPKEGKSVKVGVVKTARYPLGVNKGRIPRKKSITVAQAAYYNEFGTRDKNGKEKIPERPFLRNSANKYLTDERVKLLLKVLFGPDKTVLDGITARRLGLVLQRIMLEEMKNPEFPKNAPFTVQQKTQGKGTKTTPLIDTGLLRRSIQFEVI